MDFNFGRKNKVPDDKKIQDIELSNIVPNRYQPRKNFNEESIAELAKTLKDQGLLQPIILRHDQVDNTKYEIIAGERRYRAAQVLDWLKIPAIVENMSDEKAAALALIENLQREDLNPIDEAQAYLQFMQANNLTQSELANQMGKTQSYIANKIRLLKLTAKVQGFLITGKISQRHGRALLKLSEEDQDRTVSEIIKHGMTVKETEDMVSDVESYFKNLEPKKEKQKKETPKRVLKTGKDFKVQVNTIKQAIKMAKDSGLKVKYKEDQEKDSYKITIELLRK